MNKKYLLLNENNLHQYLINSKYRLPFLINALIKVEEVNEYSNNNFLFRLCVRKGKKNIYFFLKQARPYNRRSFKHGKPVPIDPWRVMGEVALIKRLEKLWGRGAVPHVYFFDRQNFAFLMSDIGHNGKLLIDEFVKNSIYPQIGKTLGRYLGKLHTATYKIKGKAGIGREYEQFMLGYFYDRHWGSGVRKFFPKQKVRKFYQTVKKAPFCVIWGDPVYRNIFVKPKGKISCIDFDHTVKYDPMHDLGILVAHWVWMWIKGNKKIKVEAENFLTSCSRAYWSVWKKQFFLTKKEKVAMQKRLIGWIGIYLLSRTDGKSGSYFKKWPAWEKRIRQLGIQLFKDENNALTRSLKHLL